MKPEPCQRILLLQRQILIRNVGFIKEDLSERLETMEEMNDQLLVDRLLTKKEFDIDDDDINYVYCEFN